MMKVLETVGLFPQQKVMQIYAEMPLVQAFALDPTWEGFSSFAGEENRFRSPGCTRGPSFTKQPQTGLSHGLEASPAHPIASQKGCSLLNATECFPSSFMVQILFLKLLRTQVKMKTRSSRRCFWEFADLCLSA